MKKLYIVPQIQHIDRPAYKRIDNEADEVQYTFDSQDKHIDESLEKKILAKIKDKEFDILCIPININDSFVNFDGIRVGMHIRLSEDLGNLQNKPILFLGEISIEQINKINPIGRFLHSKGVYYCGNSCSEIIEFFENNEEKIKGIDEDYRKTELYKWMYISSPSHLESSHSLSNEWGAFMIDKVVGLNTLSLEGKGLKELKQNLYFKSLGISQLQPIDEIDKVLNAKAKSILYIDDESNKGWDKVLKKLIFHKSDDKIDILQINKNQSEDEILKQIKEKANQLTWDLILLDLRLNDADHDPKNQNPDFEYCGLKALKEIKKINKGLQVIIFTASNKAWNYEKLLEENADGYFIKPNPQIDDAESIKNKVNGFVKRVNLCLNQRNYLKELYIETRTLKNCAELKNTKTYISKSNYEDFYKRSKKNLSLAFDILFKTFKLKESTESLEPKELYYPFLIYFQILEDYANQPNNYIYNKKVNGIKTNISYIKDKNEQEILVVDKSNQSNMFTELKTQKGFFPFQKRKNNNDKTVTSFKKIRNNNLKKDDIYETAMFKIACLLYFKFDKEQTEVDKFVELTFLRNNLVVHEGNIDKTRRDIQIEDVLKLFEWTKLFLMNPCK